MTSVSPPSAGRRRCECPVAGDARSVRRHRLTDAFECGRRRSRSTAVRTAGGRAAAAMRILPLRRGFAPGKQKFSLRAPEPAAMHGSGAAAGLDRPLDLPKTQNEVGPAARGRGMRQPTAWPGANATEHRHPSESGDPRSMGPRIRGDDGVYCDGMQAKWRLLHNAGPPGLALGGCARAISLWPAGPQWTRQAAPSAAPGHRSRCRSAAAR